ncbi:MAG: hypothetical protein GVY27_05740 [Deinococcus-Thermus bacterium]|nr:hypothetical protein [Deinococcota bacterium]
MSEQGFAIGDYVAILRRRLWWFLLPAVLVAVAALTAALTWPPTYRSTATVLIEEAEIPDGLVDVGFQGYVERRLEAITRRVVVTDNLIDIMERFDLYAEERAEMPLRAVAGMMRDAISLEMLTTEVINPNSGSSGEVTVAFEVSFSYGDAATAQRVTDQLVSLYLNENTRQRRERIAETTEFIAGERGRIEERIAELSGRLAAFKAEHRGVLPEQTALNQQMLMRAEADLREIERQERELRDRATILEAELAQLRLTPAAERGRGGETSPAARLESARLQLASLEASYSASHPDVVRTRNEVAVLEQLVGETGAAGSATAGGGLAEERERLGVELETLRERYGPEHPDVQQAERARAEIDAALADASAATAAVDDTDPALLPLQAQLAVVESQLDGLDRLREEARSRIAEYEGRLAQTMEIEPEYARLERALQDARTQREALVQQEQRARMGEAVESQERGERFSLIEPATMPGAPESPNRKLILLAGLVLAGGAGAGSVTLRHMTDDRISGVGDVTAEIGFEPLGMVPNITTPTERLARAAKHGLVALLVVGSVGAGGWLFHTRVIPLDTATTLVSQGVLDRVGPFLPSDLRAPPTAEEN